MAQNIEKLLSAVADLERFGKMDGRVSASGGSDLSLEELDLIAAAGTALPKEPVVPIPEFMKKK